MDYKKELEKIKSRRRRQRPTSPAASHRKSKLDPYRDELSKMRRGTESDPYSLNDLEDWLRNEHNLTVDRTTIDKRLKLWGVEKGKPKNV